MKKYAWPQDSNTGMNAACCATRSEVDKIFCRLNGNDINNKKLVAQLDVVHKMPSCLIRLLAFFN